jgi:MFS family permease
MLLCSERRLRVLVSATKSHLPCMCLSDRIPNAVINILAFDDEFGIVDPATGVAALSPRVVSLWNGLQQFGIVSGQILGAALNDRIGRKWVVVICRHGPIP